MFGRAKSGRSLIAPTFLRTYYALSILTAPHLGGLVDCEFDFRDWDRLKPV
jgi:hypothetical protein